MWRYLIPIGLFAALLAFLYFGLGRDKETLPSPLIGKPAPHVRAAERRRPGQEGVDAGFRRAHVRPEHLGQPGASAAARSTRRCWRSRAANAVPLIGLNWKDDLPLAQRWLRELGNPYAATAFDAEGRVAIDWGAYGAPETFLVDATGHVCFTSTLRPLSIEAWERGFHAADHRHKGASGE